MFCPDDNRITRLILLLLLFFNSNHFSPGSIHQLQHQTIQENQQNEVLEPRVTFFLIVEPKAYVVNQNNSTVFFYKLITTK